MSGLVQITSEEMKKRAKQKREMLRLQQEALREAVKKAKEAKQDDWVKVEHGDISAIDMIKHAIKRKGKGGKRKTRKHKKKHRRKTKRKTKRRVKRRRKTTRKKRGRGMGPSKMAKLGVAALAATTAMGQGAGHGISPSEGTVAAVNHFKQVKCKDFHITDMVEHSEDHGQPTEHYRPVLKAALAKRRGCKRRGKPMRNPNTGKKMSNKKQRQAERRRRNQQRQEQERKNQQQQQEEPQPGETSGSTGTGAYNVATVTAGMTAAAAHYYMRKKLQEEAERKRQQEEEEENSKSSNPAPFDDFGEQPQALASLKLQDEPTKKKKKTPYRTFKSKLSKLTGIKRKKTRKNR